SLIPSPPLDLHLLDRRPLGSSARRAAGAWLPTPLQSDYGTLFLLAMLRISGFLAWFVIAGLLARRFKVLLVVVLTALLAGMFTMLTLTTFLTHLLCFLFV